jgi:hypothetical protein
VRTTDLQVEGQKYCRSGLVTGVENGAVCG